MRSFSEVSASRGVALLLAGWIALWVLAGSARAAASPFPYERMGVANGCFVESVAFGDALRERMGDGVWYRLLQWGAKEADEVVAGHAVLVFEHRGRLWSYDINQGFTVLEVPVESRDDLAAVVKQVTAPYLEKITPRYPIYREDFSQVPETKRPVLIEGVAEKELRDAGLVAQRLSMRRPVALVEFTYPKDGETKHGAAAAFVYHGRLCVYTASNGTVPFRVQAQSVKNLRQLQELLRRIYPGASNLKVR